jgi:hypothetical protein
MFSPENVRAQLELEQLRSGSTLKNRLLDLYGSFLGTQGDINRLLQEKQITPDQLKTMYGVGDPEIEGVMKHGINPILNPLLLRASRRVAWLMMTLTGCSKINAMRSCVSHSLGRC